MRFSSQYSVCFPISKSSVGENATRAVLRWSLACPLCFFCFSCTEIRLIPWRPEPTCSTLVHQGGLFRVLLKNNSAVFKLIEGEESLDSVLYEEIKVLCL